MKIAVTATEPSLDARMDPRFGRCPYFLVVETDDASFEAVENQSVSLGGGAGIQSAQLMADKGVQTVLTGNCGPNAYQTLAAAGIAVIVGCGGSVADVVEQFKAGQLNAASEPSVPGKFGLGGAASPPQAVSMPPQQPPVAGPQMGMGGGGQGMGRGRGGGRGMGQGGGGGMGMGRGGGRGMGGGMGRGSGMGQGGGDGMGMGRGGGRGRGIAVGGGDMGGGMGAALPQGAVPMSQAIPASLNTNNELTMLRQQAEEMARQTQQTYERIRQLEQEGKTRTVVAKVEAEKCTGCGICVDICSVEAISLENGVAIIDERTCTACGLCVNECPNEAISMG